MCFTLTARSRFNGLRTARPTTTIFTRHSWRRPPPPQLRELARALEKTAAASASGLWGSSVAAVTAAVRAELKRPILLICGHIDEADDLADDVELFIGGERPDVLPALELGGSLGR